MKHFPHQGFQIWNGGFLNKTTSLPYVQNNPQHNMEEVVDSQARKQIRPNEKQQSDQHKKKTDITFPTFCSVFYNFHLLLSSFSFCYFKSQTRTTELELTKEKKRSVEKNLPKFNRWCFYLVINIFFSDTKFYFSSSFFGSIFPSFFLLHGSSISLFLFISFYLFFNASSRISFNSVLFFFSHVVSHFFLFFWSFHCSSFSFFFSSTHSFVFFSSSGSLLLFLPILKFVFFLFILFCFSTRSLEFLLFSPFMLLPRFFFHFVLLFLTSILSLFHVLILIYLFFYLFWRRHLSHLSAINIS